MKRKLIGNAIRALISFSLIALLLFVMRNQLNDIIAQLINVSIPFLVVAVLLTFTSHTCLSLRLKLFLTGQGINVNVKEAVGLTLIGYFFNNFLPTAVGGDMVKAYYATKKTDEKVPCFTSVFMDRCMGLFSFVVLVLFAIVVLGDKIGTAIIAWPLWIIFFIAIALLAAFFNKRIAETISSVIARWKKPRSIHRIYASFVSFRDKKPLFVKAFFLSIVAQVIAFVAVYVLIQGLHDYIPFANVLLVMPLIFLASMFPSINGLGVREGAFVLFFRPFIGADKAFVLSLLWLFIYLVMGLLGGFVYAFAKHGKRQDLVDE
jgi:uncharacterized protein (TIRG00374 family)